MSIELLTPILFCTIFALIFLGVEVSFALAGVSVVFTYLLMGHNGLYTIATTVISQITDTTLITIPLLVLMGQLLLKSGIADRLFRSVNYWLFGIRGSLALVSLAVCVALAMTGGFGPGIITMGLVAVPAMLKRNYHHSIALGSVMAGGVLGALIPPSVVMIIFAYINRLSIGRLFVGGVVPGFLTAAFFALYIALRCYLRPEIAPGESEKVSWKIRCFSLLEVLPPALLIFAVLGSIFLGLATPVEAASLGAIGALLICLLYRRLTWDDLTESCRETLIITGMVLWILISANLFRVLFTMAGAQGMLIDLVAGLGVNRWLILICMQIILLMFGTILDDFAIVVICSPIFFPIAVSLGFDPLWFAIVFILNMQMALLTPPFGWALIMMRGLAPRGVSTREIWASTPPFLVIQILVLILTMIFPVIAVWLPGKIL